MSFAIDAYLGRIPGVIPVNKFGRAPDADTGAATTVWDGADTAPTSTKLWIPPTTARVHAIASTSGNDAAAGSGMRTLEVTGLDADYEPQSETVTIGNNTVGEYTTIFRMIGKTWGTGEANAGIVTATAATDATVTAAIQAGRNQTLMAVYTVRAGYDLLIYKYYASTAAASGQTRRADAVIKTQDAVTTDAGFLTKHILQTDQAAPLQFDWPGVVVVPEKHHIVLNVESVNANDTAVNGGFNGYLLER